MYAMIQSAQAHHRQQALELQAAAQRARRRGDPSADSLQSVGRLGWLGEHLSAFTRTPKRPAGAR